MNKKNELIIVSLGDWVKELDNVVLFRVMKGDKEVQIPIRICTPMAEDDHALLEMITDEFGDDLDDLGKYETDDAIAVAPEHRKKMLRFSLLQSSCLMSSSCFEVALERNGDGNQVVKKAQPSPPVKFWKDGPSCLKKCPKPLFELLKKHLEGVGVGKQLTEVEASK